MNLGTQSTWSLVLIAMFVIVFGAGVSMRTVFVHCIGLRETDAYN